MLISGMAALQLMIPDGQIGIAVVDLWNGRHTLMIPDDQVGISGVDALKLMIPDDQVGIALKLMIPADQVGIAAVDLWNGRPTAYDPR